MNPFKAALASGVRQIGLWQALAAPYTAEICAGAGFDWLLFDGEHAPNDLPLVLAQLLAVAAYPCEPVVRLPIGDTVLIKQYLDIGARSLLIPMVETAAQAEALLCATRYPPHGNRGVGSALARASRWNRKPSYLHNAHEEICLILQIESLAGVEALPDILKVEGFDGIFVGPSDLAASLGHLGDPAHSEVQSVIRRALETIAASEKAAGILATDRTLACRYIDLGASFIAVGTDVSILARGAEAVASAFKVTDGTASDVGLDASY